MKIRRLLYVSFFTGLLLTAGLEIYAEPERAEKRPQTSQGEDFSANEINPLIVSEAAESGKTFTSDAGEPVPEIPIQGFPNEEGVPPVKSLGAEENRDLSSQGEPGEPIGSKSENLQAAPAPSKGKRPPTKTISSK